MALITNQPHASRRHVRGRERRTVTLNTKLTEAEFADVEKYCEARAIAYGEWVRELVLRELKGASADQPGTRLMAEIQALRLILINSLEPLLRGDKWTTEQFKEMLRYVKAHKRKAATELIESYQEATGE